nr:MAG TPA: hypothetical protein [Caudoviricetes sp.]
MVMALPTNEQGTRRRVSMAGEMVGQAAIQ